MSRSQRIRLVIAIVCIFLGLAIAYLGAAAVAYVMQPSLLPPGDLASQTEQAIAEHRDVWMRFSKAVTTVFIAGMAVSAVSFLYVFVAIAKWFIGPSEKKKVE